MAYASFGFGKQSYESVYGIHMSEKIPVKLSRDLEVVQIPEGYKVRLARGTHVRIMQSLGDTFTVTTEYGTMVRIAGTDADAIGEVLKTAEPVQAGDNAPTG